MTNVSAPVAKQSETPRQGPSELSQRRQLAIYNAIVAFKKANDGCAPTLREIMVATKIPSTSLVNHYLDRLAMAGLIDYVPGARNLRVRGGRWTVNGDK